MSNEGFDERQRMERGTAYRNAYGVALLCLIICILIDRLTGISFRITESLSMVFLPSASAFLITAILRDAIEGINSKTSWKSMATVFIIAGVSFIVCACLDYVGWHSDSSDKNMLDAIISNSFGGACMASVGIVYWVRQFIMHKKIED